MISAAPRTVILTVGLMAFGLVTNAALSAPTFAVASAQSEASSGPPARYPGYQVVWADEFYRDGEPDAKNWTYERGFVRNRELQWYRPGNARVGAGLLTIEARRERVPNPAFQSGSTDWRNREFAEYSSASLIGVPTLHFGTLLGTALVMTGVSLVACLIPARRASGVDPMIALHAE